MMKRFVEIDDGLDFSIKHIESGEMFYDCESVVDILNELAEENEQLKKDREELFIRERDTKNEWRELKQENERLRRCMNEIYTITRLEEVD